MGSGKAGPLALGSPDSDRRGAACCARDLNNTLFQKEGGIWGEHGSHPEIAPPTGGFMTSAEVIAIM